LAEHHARRRQRRRKEHAEHALPGSKDHDHRNEECGLDRDGMMLDQGNKNIAFQHLRPEVEDRDQTINMGSWVPARKIPAKNSNRRCAAYQAATSAATEAVAMTRVTTIFRLQEGKSRSIVRCSESKRDADMPKNRWSSVSQLRGVNDKGFGRCMKKSS
jgi:hypothetical protein